MRFEEYRKHDAISLAGLIAERQVSAEEVVTRCNEYVACQARKAAITFTKEGNCFTAISDAAGLAKIAETLSEQRAIGRLSQVSERWIYTCVCFALDFDGQKRSGFHYQYSNYQIEYSR